jgi:hypothetical protein
MSSEGVSVGGLKRATILLLMVAMVLSSLNVGFMIVGASSSDTASRASVSRTVLGEMFTATWCGPCVSGDNGISAIINDTSYFDDRFILVEWHSSDNYSIPEESPRASYYMITGVPTIVFDGQDKVTGSQGNVPADEANYKQHIDSRPSTADLTIKAWFSIDGTAGTVTINTTVQKTLSITEVGLVLNAVIVEDHQTRSPMGHYLRMTAVSMPFNEQSISVHSEGSSANFSQDISIDPKWDQSKLAVVAWVQNSNTREVLQSGIGYPPTTKPTTNSPPQYTGGNLDFSMDENAVDTHINVATVFNDPDGDKLTYGTEGSSHISTNIDATTHILSVSPAQGWSGIETIFISAKDPTHNPISKSIAVTVKEVDQPPVLKGKLTGLTFDEDSVSTTSALNTIFTDNEGDPITYKIEPTSHVNVVMNPSTTLTLTPQADWNGQETLVITASDGTYETTYEDQIVVSPVNDPPIITDYIPKDPNPQVKEGDNLQFSVSGDDVEAQSLEYKWEIDGSSVGTQMATFKYEPQYGDAGDHQVTVEVSDGKLSAAHTFHVTVLKGNRAPTVKITTPSVGVQYDEGSPITLTADVTDPDDPNLLHIEFIWSLDGTPVSNEPSFTIKPTSGSHMVTLKVSDGEFEIDDTVAFSVKAKGTPGLPGFEIGPMLVALVVALSLITWRKKQ